MEKIIDRITQLPPIKVRAIMIFGSVLLWIFDALVDHFIFNVHMSFLHCLIYNPQQIFMRIIYTILLITIGEVMIYGRREIIETEKKIFEERMHVEKERELALHEFQEKMESLHNSALILNRVQTPVDLFTSTIKIIEDVVGTHWIGIAEPKKDEMVVALSSHYAKEEALVIQYDQPSIIMRAYKTRETVFVKDITKDPDYVSVDDDIQYLSELVVPVFVDDEIRALINIESTIPEEIGESERRLIEIVALHVSSALERIQRTAELRESEERLRILSQNAGDAILMVNQERNIVFWNPAAERMFGYAEEDIKNKKLEELIVPEERWESFNEEFYAIIERKVDLGSKVLNSVGQRSDGSMIELGFTATVIELDDITHVIFIMRDVTEQKRAQERIFELLEQMRSLNTEFERSNKDLENYTYVVSHDLKAPLRSIRSFGGFIMEDNADQLDEDGKEYLNRIITAATHMDDLISDLLLLSRVGRRFTEPEEVNLNEIIDGIKEDIYTIIEEKGALINVSKLPTVYTQKTWIRQLFMNLITNGLKFNESGNPIIDIQIEENSREYIFSVADNGIGISPEYHEKIFQLFERLHTNVEYEGTGAGLTICMKIVEDFGGKLWVESEEEQGSTFYFTFPKALGEM